MADARSGEGLNWTMPKLLFPQYGSFDRNRIILSLTGAWLYPMYYAGKLSSVLDCNMLLLYVVTATYVYISTQQSLLGYTPCAAFAVLPGH